MMEHDGDAQVRYIGQSGFAVRSRATRRLVVGILIGSAITFGSAVEAVQYACKGSVEQVTVDRAGIVSVTFNFQAGTMAWQTMCGLNATHNGVSPAACKGMLVLLTSARLSGQTIQMWFDNSTPGQCNATAWADLNAMGWYWGPSLAQ